MKKQRKKLVLAKETVKNLEHVALGEVAGGSETCTCSGTIVACTSYKWCPNMPNTSYDGC